MRGVAPLLLAAILSACSGVESFEDDLVGPQAAAWELCKTEYGEAIGTPPTIAKQRSDSILFVWSDQDLEKIGGLDTCETNGEGTELIEMRIQGPPF